MLCRNAISSAARRCSSSIRCVSQRSYATEVSSAQTEEIRAQLFSKLQPVASQFGDLASLRLDEDRNRKFAVLASVMQALDREIPSSELAKINTIDDVANWYIQASITSEQQSQQEVVVTPENLRLFLDKHNRRRDIEGVLGSRRKAKKEEQEDGKKA